MKKFQLLIVFEFDLIAQAQRKTNQKNYVYSSEPVNVGSPNTTS